MLMRRLIIIFALLVMPFAMNAQDWTLVNSFVTSTGRQHGVVYDGENIYTAAWGKSTNVLYMFYKYDLEGNLLDEFDIPGINEINYVRDMTYDGTYFYGCDGSTGNIWCLDLHNKALVGSIPTNFPELRCCTYDPVYDAFWVNGNNTGSQPNLFLDMHLVSRNGVVLKSASTHPLGGHTVKGTGYFTDEDGVAHIYIHAVQGFTAHVFDYVIEADTMDPNYIFDMGQTPGFSVAGSAGAAYIGVIDGVQCFFGDIDQSPNLIGIYALGEYTPAPPTPPQGDIFFDFNDGIMRWNLIDADGDGYNWQMRQNWGQTSNPYSVTSASYDDLTGTILFPENYFVTPYKLDCEQITFIAQAQDANAPAEHFGVAVSTTTGATAEDFEIVWETDMTTKAPGNWHAYDVDLRAYQGQDIYVAIVHFNCSDQFMLNIDNVRLNRTYQTSVDETLATFTTVYPNPTSDKLLVESVMSVNSYEIYNVAGAMVASSTIEGNTFEVNVSEMPAGTYLIKIMSEGMVQTKRFVKR